MAQRWKTPRVVLAIALLTLLPAGMGLRAPGVLSSVAEATSRPRVVVYMTAWCTACRRHMNGLHRLRVPYRTIDIERDPESYEPIRQRLGRTTIPVTIVQRRGDQRWIVGANSGAVQRAYEELSE